MKLLLLEFLTVIVCPIIALAGTVISILIIGDNDKKGKEFSFADGLIIMITLFSYIGVIIGYINK